MTSQIFLDNKKYISAKDAGKVAGYTSDYVGQLCRKNLLDCRKVGKVWMVTEESVLNHERETKKATVNRGKKLFVEREVLKVAIRKDISVKRDDSFYDGFKYSLDNRDLIPTIRKSTEVLGWVAFQTNKNKGQSKKSPVLTPAGFSKIHLSGLKRRRMQDDLFRKFYAFGFTLFIVSLSLFGGFTIKNSDSLFAGAKMSVAAVSNFAEDVSSGSSFKNLESVGRFANQVAESSRDIFTNSFVATKNIFGNARLFAKQFYEEPGVRIGKSFDELKNISKISAGSVIGFVKVPFNNLASLANLPDSDKSFLGNLKSFGDKIVNDILSDHVVIVSNDFVSSSGGLKAVFDGKTGNDYCVDVANGSFVSNDWCYK